ncbi:MAG: CBS domain-containing protein [Nitrospirae bacterium]|nr:CBS domain-containing protein [Nitrospirota bacterium]
MIPLISVDKIMSRNIAAIDSHEPIVSAAKIMKQQKTGSLLVKRNESLVGIVTDVDMTRKVLAGELDQYVTPVEAVMSSPFYTIDAEDSVAKANEMMTQYNIRHLVVTEGGVPAGIISARDILEPIYEEEGSIPFWPNHALKEIGAAFLLIAILGTLILLSPAPMEPKADPLTTPEHIKPEWFFLAAYQILKFAEILRFLGDWAPKVIGILFEGAFVFLLFAVPFIDKNPERAYRKRPIAIGLGILFALIFMIFTVWGHIS